MRRRALAAFALLAAAVFVPSSSGQAAPAPAPAPKAGQQPRATTPPITSYISGTVTDAATGGPAAGACVTAYNPNRQVLAQVCAGADGRYRIDNAIGSSILLRADHGTGHTYWPGNTLDANFATYANVVAGYPALADITVDQRVGTVRGTITRQDGTPAVAASVTLHRVDSTTPVAYAVTAADGTFQRDGIPVGRYLVSVNGSGYGVQWVPSKATRAEAGTVEVTEGGTLDVTERFRALEPAPALPNLVTVSGVVLTSPGGAPVPNAEVTLYANGMVELARVRTDAEGRYAAPNLRVALPTFRKVTAAGYATTWLPQSPEPYSAPSAVATPVTHHLRAGSGRLKAQITDYDGKVPHGGALIVLTRPGDEGWSYTVPLRFDGSLDVANLPAGQYRLSISPSQAQGSRPVQYYPGTVDVTKAGLITVTDGQTTAITDTLAGPAVVEVTLRDAVTDAPISGACVQMGPVVCTDANGVYRIESDWQTGAQIITATHAPYHYQAGTTVTAGPGPVTKVTLKMQPGAVIATTYQDDDMDAAGDVCVYAVRGNWGTEVTDNGGGTVCARPDSGGKLLLGPFQPGTVRLFVKARGSSGAQWLGRTGGTGDRRTAVPLELRTGQTTTAPVIVASGQSGAITGRFLDADAAQPVPYGCAQAGLVSSCGPEYHLNDLGPYAWAVDYWSQSNGAAYAGTSGDLPHVQVKADIATSAIPLLRRGDAYRADLGATPPAQFRITVYDAYTGFALWSGSDVYPYAVPAGAVTIRLDHDGQTCWGSWGTVNRRTPYLVLPPNPTSPISLAPGSTCRAGEPARLFRPAPTMFGPLVVKSYERSPLLRGGAVTVAPSAGPAPARPVSPWGVPTLGRLERVKP